MEDRHCGGGIVPAVLEDFASRLARICGSTAARDVLDTMRSPKRTGYVVNTLLDPLEAPPGTPVPGLAGCFSVSPEARASLLEHPAVAAGRFYPMNPSSVLAARAITACGGMEVLDLAAAPGGKTLLLAMAMGNRERIAAVEPVKARFHRMRANLTRCGVTNVQFYAADGRRIGSKVPGRFDRVLLDAPCSSEARIRLEDPATYGHWKPRKIRETARKQRGLIRSGFEALKPGGEMIYCTCAFAPEENELVVSHLLETEPDACLLPLDTPGVPGLTVWADRPLGSSLALTRRVLPDDLYDGFFLARIGKGR